MEIREAPICMYLIQKPFLVYLFNLFCFFKIRQTGASFHELEAN